MITVDRSPSPNYLSKTLSHLSDIGFDRDLVIFDSGSSLEKTGLPNRRLSIVSHRDTVCANENVCDALVDAAGCEDWVLFLEDDIDVCGDFIASVERWLFDHQTTLPIIYPLGANYGEVEQAFARGETSWQYPIHKFYGTQAFAIRSRDVATYTEYIREHCFDLHEDGTGYDHLIRDCATLLEMTHFVTPAPSFVQHIGTTSVINPRPADKIHTFPSFPGHDWSYPDEKPTLVVLTPFRNARRNLRLYFKQIAELRDHLDMRVRLVAAEGNSTDGTRQEIVRLTSRHGLLTTIIDVTHDHNQPWGSVEDPTRLKCMSDIMNAALDEVTEQDDVVLWIMSDLDYDPLELSCKIDTLLDNSSTHTDEMSLLTPMPMVQGTDLLWDTWALRKSGVRFSNFTPYHKALSESSRSLIPVSSSGTLLLMHSRVPLDGVRTKDNEAVEFCQEAYSKGYEVLLDRTWRVDHITPNKHLLWVGSVATVTGLGRCTHAVLPALAAEGYVIDVVAIDWIGGPNPYPYNFYPAEPQADGNRDKGVQVLYDLVRGQDHTYDVVVILGDPWDVEAYIYAMDEAGKQREGCYPDTVLGWLMVDGQNIQMAGLDRLDAIVVPTYYGRDELEVCMDVAGTSIHTPTVVPLGVQKEIFKPIPQAKAREACLAYDHEGKYIIGVVAKNQGRKKLDTILEAFAVATAPGGEDCILHLHIIGKQTAVDATDIKSLAVYWGVDDRVVIDKRILNDFQLAALYNCFDVLVSASSAEAFNLTVAEAAACEVPVVVSDIIGHSWVPQEQICVSVASGVVAPVGGRNLIGRYTAADDLAQLLLKGEHKLLDRDEIASWQEVADRVVGVVETAVAGAAKRKANTQIQAEFDKMAAEEVAK